MCKILNFTKMAHQFSEVPCEFSGARLVYETPELFEKIVNCVIFSKTGELLKSEAEALCKVPGKFAAVVNECIYHQNRQLGKSGSGNIYFQLYALKELSSADQARNYYLQFLNTEEPLLPPFSMCQPWPDRDNLAVIFTPLISTFGYALVKLDLKMKSDNPPLINPSGLNLPNLKFVWCSYASTSKDADSHSNLDHVAATTMQSILSAATNCLKLCLSLEIHGAGFLTNFRFPPSLTEVYLDGTHVGEWLRNNMGVCKNLTDLSISQCLVGMHPTAKDFYDFLSSCSKSLVSLQLNNNDFVPYRGDFHLCPVIEVAFPPLMPKVETLLITGGHWKLQNVLENDQQISTNWPAVGDLRLQFLSSSEMSKWFSSNRFSAAVEALQIGVYGIRGVQMQSQVLTLDEIRKIHSTFPNIEHLDIQLGNPETSEVFDYIFERMVNLKELTIFSENGIHLSFDDIIPKITNMKNLESFQLQNGIHFVSQRVKLTDRSFTNGIFLLEKLKACKISEKLLAITDGVRERYLNSYQREGPLTPPDSDEEDADGQADGDPQNDDDDDVVNLLIDQHLILD